MTAAKGVLSATVERVPSKTESTLRTVRGSSYARAHSVHDEGTSMMEFITTPDLLHAATSSAPVGSSSFLPTGKPMNGSVDR